MDEFKTIIMDTLKRLISESKEFEIRVYNLMHEASRMVGYDRLNSRAYSDMERAFFNLVDSGAIKTKVYPDRVMVRIPAKREIYQESGYKDPLIIGY